MESLKESKSFYAVFIVLLFAAFFIRSYANEHNVSVVVQMERSFNNIVGDDREAEKVHKQLVAANEGFVSSYNYYMNICADPNTSMGSAMHGAQNLAIELKKANALTKDVKIPNGMSDKNREKLLMEKKRYIEAQTKVAEIFERSAALLLIGGSDNDFMMLELELAMVNDILP